MKDDDTDKTLEVWQAARKEMRRLQGEHNKAVGELDGLHAVHGSALEEFDTQQRDARAQFIKDQQDNLSEVLGRMKALSEEYGRAVAKCKTLGTKMQSSVGDEVSRDQGSIAGGLRLSAADKAEAERVAKVLANSEAAAKALGKAEVQEAPQPPRPAPA